MALTFDIGPAPGIAEHVLDILITGPLQATFFVVGEPGGRAPARRARAEGHWVADYSMTLSVPLGEKSGAEGAAMTS